MYLHCVLTRIVVISGACTHVTFFSNFCENFMSMANLLDMCQKVVEKC